MAGTSPARKDEREYVALPGARQRYWILAGVVMTLFVLTFGGGSSRPDEMALLVVRPVVILMIVPLLLAATRGALAPMRLPLLALAGFAGLMALQLVPLPVGLWAALPGRGPIAAAAAAGGLPVGYHSLSLSPDLTINAIIALLPALFGLLAWPLVVPAQRTYLLSAMLAIVVFSAVLGIVQLGASGLELFVRSHHRMAAGIFANRNHHATLLAMGLPLLRIWSLTSRIPGRGVIAAGLGLLLLLVVLATGSRAGLLIAVIAGLATLMLAPPSTVRLQRRWAFAAGGGVVTIAVLLVTIAINTGVATSVTRFQNMSVGSDLRWRFLPLVWRMITDFFPFGAGAGTFDPVFRMLEPDWALKPTYFNHAHNELLELLCDGGALFLVPLVVFFGWILTKVRQHVALSLIATTNRRLAFVMIIVPLAASLVDYPLRTPVLSTMLGLAVGLFSLPPREQAASRDNRLYRSRRVG